MIAAHEKNANIAAGVWIVTIVMLVAMVLGGFVDGNIWDTGNIPVITVFSIHGLAMCAALWFYAKAKGYWGIFGVSLAFFSFVGLLVLMLLPDRRPLPQ